MSSASAAQETPRTAHAGTAPARHVQTQAHTNIYDAESDERLVSDPSGYKFYKSTVVHRPVDGGGAGWNWGPTVMTHHRETAIDQGASWNFGTHAEYLEQDESGRVTGVVAYVEAEDKYVRFTATKGVVLAAGDFMGNEDMIRDINDEYRHPASSSYFPNTRSGMA